jgi:hypothetical protein
VDILRYAIGMGLVLALLGLIAYYYFRCPGCKRLSGLREVSKQQVGPSDDVYVVSYSCKHCGYTVTRTEDRGPSS